MNYLMVGGPLDGRILQFEDAPAFISDPTIPGAYVLSRLSDKVAVYHWKVLQDRWERRHKRVAWGHPVGVSSPLS